MHDPRSYLPCAPQLSFKPTGPDTRGTSSWARLRYMRAMPRDAWARALTDHTGEPCAVSALLSDTRGAMRARAAPSTRMRGNGHRRWGALHDGMVPRVGPSVMHICPYASQVSFVSRHGDCLCHPQAARCLRLPGGCAHLSATRWEAPGRVLCRLRVLATRKGCPSVGLPWASPRVGPQVATLNCTVQ